MNNTLRPAVIGAGAGFVVTVCLIVFHIRTPFIVYTLWPTRILERAATGGFWLLLFRTVAFFANAFLYGLIGYCIGRYIERRRKRDGHIRD